MVCISSSKLAEGLPTSTPSEGNGNGPLNRLWKSVMSCCWSITLRLAFFCPALSDDAWAS